MIFLLFFLAIYNNPCSLGRKIVTVNISTISAEDALIARFRLIPYLKLKCKNKKKKNEITDYEKKLKKKVVDYIMNINVTKELATKLITYK